MAAARVGVLASHLRPAAEAAAEGCAAASGPLAGVRVIDISQMVSGPMGCQILADQGADVIKVEPITGDATRGMSVGMSSTFCIINRNKRSLSIDLRAAEGKELLMRLVRTADVFVQNFRPGAADRLGIGYEAVSRARPDIVYVSISGFGEVGPYAQKRVYDPVIQAVSGLASIQADESGRPRMMRLIIPDKVTALTSSQAITAALFERQRTGRGQHVKLSMIDATAAFLWPEGMAAHTFVRGAEMKQLAGKGGLYSRDLVYELKDGFITVGAVTMKEWKGLCEALGRTEWLRDPRFRDAAGVARHRDARIELAQSVLKSWTCEEALRKLDQNQVPCAPVHHPREKVLDDPQFKANGTIVEHEHHIQGPMRFPRPAARFSASDFSVRTPAPLIGEQSAEILAELGVGAAEIGRLMDSGVVRKKPGLH